MNRREALATTARLLGGTIVGSNVFLNGCKSTPEKIASFSEHDIAFLDAVGEVIIPTTPRSPGAKAARIGEFMNVMVTDCYDEHEQKIFFDGITTLKALAQQKHDTDFVSLSGDDQRALLNAVNKEAKAYANTKLHNDPEHYFTLIKQLTTLGYFTSEPGATTARTYVAVPGRFEGCIPFSDGKAWAT
ncbi:gluconate 2-dehydrogenase subunit 3 family protein [Chryseolinea lacunae]|uniref:Gluconate 2-dehydrogenase subunit 3 family protein n=1 Tax=Chryseolinea lacunae TaxID=2801331 RepID=A0ABS1L049_9BACT|nr:gluconate 2-dehydrogenase subunit 3 family protein [Chryseolinea lacunae]MBL0745076.1 gluconate 2-dehydrogenase subunit 3 family protein [Chryseolinea lacunae]